MTHRIDHIMDLLDQGLDPNWADSEGIPLTHLVPRELVLNIIERGADPNSSSILYSHLIHKLVRHEDIINLIKAGADPNAPDHTGEIVITKALRSIHTTDTIKQLLELGAEPRPICLEIMDQYKEPTNMILLVKHGLSPELALPYIIKHKRYMDIPRLVKYGLDKDTQIDGMTMVTYLILYPNLVKQLLDLGCDPNLENEKGGRRLPIEIAMDNRLTNVIIILVQHGVDPNKYNLLKYAFQNANHLMKMLLGAGADPNLGKPSCFDMAIVQQDLHSVKLMLEYGGRTENMDKIVRFIQPWVFLKRCCPNLDPKHPGLKIHSHPTVQLEYVKATLELDLEKTFSTNYYHKIKTIFKTKEYYTHSRVIYNHLHLFIIFQETDLLKRALELGFNPNAPMLVNQYDKVPPILLTQDKDALSLLVKHGAQMKPSGRVPPYMATGDLEILKILEESKNWKPDYWYDIVFTMIQNQVDNPDIMVNCILKGVDPNHIMDNSYSISCYLTAEVLARIMAKGVFVDLSLLETIILKTPYHITKQWRDYFWAKLGLASVNCAHHKMNKYFLPVHVMVQISNCLRPLES